MTDLNKKKSKFYRSMFLECICEADRQKILINTLSKELDDFRREIADKHYDELLASFNDMMRAETAILFQIREGKLLSEGENGRSINILSRSKENMHQIGILRSELLHFYCSPFKDDWDGPSSSLLLDIRDTVRVVLVGETQRDPMVCKYTREACVITYIQLSYTDQLTAQKKYVYFAFLFEEAKKDDLMGLLESIRCFLAFRYDLKQRIEKDFNGNLFGQKAEATWCSDWLSKEKAGAHTDSSEISRLLEEKAFESSNIMDVMFSRSHDNIDGNKNGDKKENKEEDKKTIYRFIYNVNISMYYRAAISQHASDSFAVDNIVRKGSENKMRYHFIEDVLLFTAVGTDKIRYGQEGCSDGDVMDEINTSVLYGKKSILKNDRDLNTGGIPKPKTLTIQRRYLQAFLMDILHNIGKHGKKGCPARIYLEKRQEQPGYLVFCNEVSTERKGNLEHWCLAENYALKQAAEFDHCKNQNSQKGMSLGCIAHCMNHYGNLVVRYKHENNRLFFEIKLPIIQQEGI